MPAHSSDTAPHGLPRPHLAVYVLLAVSLVLNIVLITRSGDSVEAPPPAPIAETEPTEAPVVVEPVEVTEDALAIDVPAEGQAAPDAPTPGAWVQTTADVKHSIARTFGIALGDEDGPRVSAEYARLFVWDFDMMRDLQRGDSVAAVWRKTGDGDHAEYEVAAARLKSNKKGDLRAYRFSLPGEKWPTYWTAAGDEIERRLVHGPLDTYEQVTSLLKDRPTHAGMDFKTPVGTPIKSPAAGTVLRANWNWRYNGNCLEIRLDDNTVVKFLHLSENQVKPGDRVRRGQVVGLTGNTGKSTAPHLHYELAKNGRVIDPLDYHRLERRSIPAAQRAAFDAEVRRLDALLNARGEG